MISMNKHKILSILAGIFYPTIVAIPLIVVLAWGSLFDILVGILFISIAPMAFIYIFSKRKHTDWDVSDQTKRKWPFIVAMFFQVLAVLFFVYSGSAVMLALSTAYLFVTFALYLVNFFTKISVHCAGVSGACMDIVYIYGWPFSILFLLVVVVAYDRIRLNAHTLKQTIYGTILSAVLSYLVFYTIMG